MPVRDLFLLPHRVFVGALIASVCLASGCLSHKPAEPIAGPVAAPDLLFKPGPTDDDAPEEFTTTKSGLKYRILRKSDGRKPNAKSTVTCHYKGWLDNKTVFDSSYKNGEAISFRLDNVISGWTEGLQYVAVGGMIELELPGDLGYGTSGSVQGGIPPNATLHFIVELLAID
jgi:FKBP-type peptidyl-prolyl cis-trans isomerase